jgi:cytochrome c peroxidase
MLSFFHSVKILTEGGKIMKGAKIGVLIVFAALLGVGIALAVQNEASMEKGKALFNDPKLGTTGKSCNDCHPGGKDAEKAATKSDADIARIVNACITHSIKGKVLDEKSAEMQSLVMYIKSFGNKPAAAPKKAPVGC